MAPPNRTRSGTLTGPRPPGQARRPSPVQAYDDSDLGEGDDDEPDGGRRLEEGSASGAETSESGAEYYYREDKMSQRGMRSTGLLTGQSASGTSKEGSEWEELVSKMQDVARRWKRLLQRQGLAATSRVHLPPIPPAVYDKARRYASHPLLLKFQPFLPSSPPSPRRVVTILLFLFAGYLFLPARKVYAPSRWHKVLTGSGFAAAMVDRTMHGSGNRAKVLESFSNPYGYISLIDPYAGGVFNPSLLVLPDTLGDGFRHLVVARGAERFEVIEGDETRWQQIVGCFMLPMVRPYLKIPYMARESMLETLNLPALRKMPFLRCQDKDFDQFVGPEDPRLFFTNDGQPLLVYSQSGRSPNICRAIYIVDARVVIPDLQKAMKKGGWDPPIVFNEQTDLIREDQSNVEKNWSPFLGEQDELFFHVSLVPQQIYKYVPGLTLRALDPSPPSTNCLTEIIGAEMNRVKFHHATPLLRVTLCRRGECVPDIHNTVLFGLIHVKYHPLPYMFYEKRIVTWNVTSPYEYLSISKPLTYSGTNQADPIFTVSLSWDHPTKRHGLGLNHGFLDDVVMTSFGVYDYGSAYIDVLARDMLTDHTMCRGTEGSGRLW